MSKFPAVVKLDSGDTLFAEVSNSTDDEYFINVYYPYKVDIIKEQIQLMNWVPFSDDKTYKIPVSKVVNVSNMDAQHKKIYSQFIFLANTEKIKTKVTTLIKDNFTNPKNLSDDIENMLDEFLISTAEIGMVYGVPIPEHKKIRDQFYSYVITCFPNYEVLENVKH